MGYRRGGASRAFHVDGTHTEEVQHANLKVVHLTVALGMRLVRLPRDGCDLSPLMRHLLCDLQLVCGDIQPAIVNLAPVHIHRSRLLHNS